MTPQRTTIAAGVGVLLVAGLAGWGIPRWRQAIVQRQDAKARESVVALLAEGKPRDALRVVRMQPRPFRHPAWPALELRTVTAARDLYALDGLFRRDPEALARSEDATLLLLRAGLAGRAGPRYESLRDAWRGRERATGRWRLLDADALLQAGKKEAAVALLRSATLTGADEAGRLLRLAFTTAPDDAKQAWNLLSQARAGDPQNPDIRSFCAQFLEAAGRPAEARVEYAAAALAEPANPLLRDQLAEFYRRQGSLDLAVRTWSEALVSAPLDYLWIKALFWGRVVQPLPTALPSAAPDGALAPLIVRLRATPPGRFLDTDAAPGTRVPATAARAHPEVFWLTVLEQLRTGREGEALALLDLAPPRARDLQPDLGAALRQILALRRNQAMPRMTAPAAVRSESPERHAFFAALEALRQAPERTPPQAQFLKGPHAFAAVCLAAGWRGAALTLWAEQPLPAEVPEWYVYALAQALRYNRGPDAALALLATTPSTPLLSVLAAELLLMKERIEDGCARLTPLAARADAIGERAAWLLAVTRMEQGRREEVRALLAQQPRLAGSVTGRELAARLELAAENLDQAETLYRALAGQSVEARVWLARRAVLRKDWDEARRLTLELIALMPEEMELRQSLAAIDAEARRK